MPLPLLALLALGAAAGVGIGAATGGKNAGRNALIGALLGGATGGIGGAAIPGLASTGAASGAGALGTGAGGFGTAAGGSGASAGLFGGMGSGTYGAGLGGTGALGTGVGSGTYGAGLGTSGFGGSMMPGIAGKGFWSKWGTPIGLGAMTAAPVASSLLSKQPPQPQYVSGTNVGGKPIISPENPYSNIKRPMPAFLSRLLMGVR